MSRPNFELEYYLGLPPTFSDHEHVSRTTFMPVASLPTHEPTGFEPAIDVDSLIIQTKAGAIRYLSVGNSSTTTIIFKQITQEVLIPLVQLWVIGFRPQFQL